MAVVPQKTLHWLWSVLQRDYRDAQRTYNDIAQTLALYPALVPRTDTYTYENGVSALLLHLKGTLPVNFRGSQYQFPIAIWVPQAYPYASPILYIAPTDDMVVRPGQHVSGSDGRIYHPYLARWRESWQRSTLVDFLKLLADAFAKEPPVVARQQTSSAGSMPPQAQPPPRPPPPGEQRPPARVPQSSTFGGPPPPPPKPSGQVNGTNAQIRSHEQSTQNRYDTPPPLPGQRPPPRPQSITSPSPNNYQTQLQPQRQSSLRQSYPRQHSPGSVQYQPQRQSTYGQPMQPPSQPGQSTAQLSMPQSHLQQPQARPHPPNPFYPQGPPYSQPPHPAQFQQQDQPQLKPKPREPNLMDESPFDVTLPTTSRTNIAIASNPEKQRLLSTLSSALLQNLYQQVSQSNSAIGPLQSQYSALQQSENTLQAELSTLQALQSQLSSNISSLNTTLSSADTVIKTASSESSDSNTNKIPAIDELIIPPTVVSRQLYDAVAEQRGYEAAIQALNEGFVRGRIGSEVWGRKVRECAREEFRRKWLIRKIGRGMGLDTSHE